MLQGKHMRVKDGVRSMYGGGPRKNYSNTSYSIQKTQKSMKEECSIEMM
jgi:hypothetical protein